MKTPKSTKLSIALLVLGLSLGSGCSHVSRDWDGKAARAGDLDAQRETKVMGYDKGVPTPSTPTLPTTPVASQPPGGAPAQ